jgi:hypothetical protein
MDESEQSIHKQFKLTQLAYRACDELGLDFFYQIKTAKLPVNTNYTVDIPENCLNIVKAGILNARGEIVPLYQNNKLTTYADLFPDRMSKVIDNSVLGWYVNVNNVYFNYWDGFSYGNLYGVPSGQPFVGSFKIDNENGVILLSNNFAFEYLIVEYLAGPAPDQTVYVPIQFKEAIIAYLAWKDIKSIPTSRRGAIMDKRDRRHEYYNERRLAIARYKPIRMSEAYQLNLENQRLTVKA